MMYQAHQVPPQTPEFDHQSVLKLERLQSHLKKALSRMRAQQAEIAALRHALAEKDRRLEKIQNAPVIENKAKSQWRKERSHKLDAERIRQRATAKQYVQGLAKGTQVTIRDLVSVVGCNTVNARKYRDWLVTLGMLETFGDKGRKCRRAI